ncbi:hypothetical protein ACH4FV_26840, partial [Streptomyces anulatus]
DQLAKGNEPEFNEALSAKKTSEADAAKAPAKGRAAEDQQLSAAKQNAAASGAQAMAGLTSTRAAAGKQVDGGKNDTKSKDEKKRAEVTAKLRHVYDGTKKDVEDTLSGLDKKVDSAFTSGEKSARDAFTADHKSRMKKYKDKRYSGLMGKGRWIKDKFAGLPKAANDLYQESRKLYVSKMQTVISQVADIIGTELGKAKARIAKGRTELKAEVDRLPADLKQFGQEAAKDFAGKFDDLEATVNEKSEQLVQDLAQKYTAALNKIDEEIKKLQEANKGLIDKAKDAIVGAIKTINELKNLLLGILAKAASAIMKIIKDPIGFLGNLVKAVGAGLNLFITNIADHLKTGVVSWLLGTAVKAGLDLPQKFDLKGIIQLIGSMLGLTWDNIRTRVTRKGVPDEAMSAVETSVPVAKNLAAEGPAGAVKEIQAEAGDLKATILGKLTTYLIPTVLIAGITWIISLLNPASAFVRAVKGIIDIVTFIVTQGAQIADFVNAVLDAVIAIANGGQAGVPKLIETALATSIPLLIGFLAALLGIGGLANKVKSVFQSVSRPVTRAIDKIVDFIAKKGKALWAKIKPNGKSKKKPTRHDDQPPTPEQKAKILTAASTEAHRKLVSGATPGQMRGILRQVHRKHAPKGLTSLRMERTGEHRFRVTAKGSPEKSSTDVHLQTEENPSKAPEHISGDENALPLGRRLEQIWQNAQKSAQTISDETETELKNLLNTEAKTPKPKQQPRDDTTWARGVLKFKTPDHVGVETRRAASGARLKDHSKVHNARGAHAEEQLTLHFRGVDLPKFPTNPKMVSNLSILYEVSRSPCVNCANMIADFVTRELTTKTSSEVKAVVAATQLYVGSTVFTGEIMQRYRKIFEAFSPGKKVELLDEVQKALQEKINQEKAETGKAKTKLIPDRAKRFAGHPGTIKGRAKEDDRRATEWKKIPLADDVRHEWFHISRGQDHGRLGLAILRAQGIEITSLGGAALGLGHPNPQSESDRPLTPAESAAMTTEEKKARARFLDELNVKGNRLMKEADKVDERLKDGPGDSSQENESADNWVEDHGYVGG